jgi:PhzF family phenazine biosynthesis protein
MKQYIVDAFTDQVFHGNQAAVCILDDWLPEDLMMNITRENNFSETAFAVKEGDKYHLRWFTPGGEIDLCGHATLACAYVLFRFYLPEAEKIVFSTLSGGLTVTRKDDGLLEMEFPAYQLKRTAVTKEMAEALGAEPKEAYLGRDLLCVFDDEAAVRNLSPDMEKVKNLEGLLLNVTAPGKDTDCVSRSFAPKLNVTEEIKTQNWIQFNVACA